MAQRRSTNTVFSHQEQEMDGVFCKNCFIDDNTSHIVYDIGRLVPIQKHENRIPDMIKMIDIGLADAIAYRIEGKITEKEMKTVLAIFKEKIKKNENLIVYQEVVSIGGAEFDAMIEKFKFFVAFGLSHFSKIAVVTHKKWIHKLVDLEGKLFRGIEMRGFSKEEKDQAIEFLNNG